MPLGNGHAGSLYDEKMRYANSPSQINLAQRIAQQGKLQSYLVAEGGVGLATNLREIPLDFAQRLGPPPGIMDGFVKTCQRWGLTDKDQLVLLGFADNEFLGTQLLNGRWLRPSQDVKDRVGYVVGISIGLGAIFDEAAEAEVMWLRTAHPKLRDSTPLAHMLGGRMSALMTVANLVAFEREL